MLVRARSFLGEGGWSETESVNSLFCCIDIANPSPSPGGQPSERRRKFDFKIYKEKVMNFPVPYQQQVIRLDAVGIEGCFGLFTYLQRHRSRR